jgi:hypothetical protein
MLPIGALVFLDEVFNINIFHYINQIDPLNFMIKLLFVAYCMVLPGYRAKLASDAYGDRDMTLTQAHIASGVMLRTHLSFIPIIGFIFNMQNAENLNQDIVKIIDEKNRFEN